MARRVFLGLTEVAGYFSNLETGLRELGVEVEFRDFSINPLGYSTRPWPTRSARARLLNLAAAPPRSWRRRVWRWAAAAYRRLRLVRSITYLPVALIRFDTFILAGGGMFLDGRELGLLKRLGKRVVIVFTGSDHRPPYLNGLWVRDAMETGYRQMARDSRRIQARVERVERWADAIVALPESAQFHRRPFIDFLRIGFPFTAPLAPVAVTRTTASVRALHCPTTPSAKGSSRIREAVGELRERGVALDLVEISGRPHREVLAALSECDFVIDEVYSDSPMAGFATEAGYFGRPAVVGGYAARQSADIRTDWEPPPTLFVEPDGLRAAIELLATDAPARTDLGERASGFVRTHWSPATVARRLMDVVEGNVPAPWLIEPDNVQYIDGWGLTRDSLRLGLRGMIDAFGPGALAMDHRPAVRTRLLEVAG
jgi:hypothetical protein